VHALILVAKESFLEEGRKEETSTNFFLFFIFYNIVMSLVDVQAPQLFLFVFFLYMLLAVIYGVKFFFLFLFFFLFPFPLEVLKVCLHETLKSNELKFSTYLLYFINLLLFWERIINQW
jgi:hypothetical protein